MCLFLAVLGLCYFVGLPLDTVSGVAASSCEVATLPAPCCGFSGSGTRSRARGPQGSRLPGSRAQAPETSAWALSTWGRPGPGD